jgi:hypothetical protein
VTADMTTPKRKCLGGMTAGRMAQSMLQRNGALLRGNTLKVSASASG